MEILERIGIIVLAKCKGVAIVDWDDFDLVAQYPWHRERPRSSKTAYAVRTMPTGHDGKQRKQKMHQLIMDYTGIDHRDGDGLNCRQSNLRPANQSQQNANKGKRSDNTSGYIGVCWNRTEGKWVAQVRQYGKCVWSERFDEVDLEMAVSVRDAIAREVWGEFAVLNFPTEKSDSD